MPIIMLLIIENKKSICYWLDLLCTKICRCCLVQSQCKAKNVTKTEIIVLAKNINIWNPVLGVSLLAGTLLSLVLLEEFF